MKYFILVTFLSFNLFANDGSERAENVKTIFNPPKDGEVFVPPGFDDLDEAEITFVNHSKNSCFVKTYSLAPQVDHDKKVIKISNMSMVLKSDFCKMRSFSSPTTLKIGELKEGTYKVEFETGEGEYKSYADLNISKSKTEQKDDFEYAPLDINGLTVRVNSQEKKIELNLPGSFPNGCYAFKDIKVIDNRSETVIEVLPVVEMVTEICTQDIQFFNKVVSIPYNVNAPTKKLIHIRAADGVAINRVVNLE